ncbi:MAG TPA: hypothetical protein VK501_25175 [Baekduia sp.]|uniref:hypothetical protein n=1 Tax=Baekduia sp. TaxID=2600305 RepID=UPI002B863ABA|nr:hypothetical protein [Baekduia sp.]HMJ37221.1 hypothetical protein [Baekduia sp.]
MRAVLELWRRGQRGWPAPYPLVQLPNVPLIVALVAAALSRLVDGAAHDVARVVFYAALAVWAADELARGSNAFRRALGAAVLAYLAVRLVADI